MVQENPAPGAIVGRTIGFLLGDQFARLKIGDRYFYDLGLDEKTMFSTKQLRELRKVSMARIICDNSDGIIEIQPEVFKSTTSTNVKVSCADFNRIPTLDIREFSQGL